MKTYTKKKGYNQDIDDDMEDKDLSLSLEDESKPSKQIEKTKRPVRTKDEVKNTLGNLTQLQYFNAYAKNHFKGSFEQQIIQDLDMNHELKIKCRKELLFNIFQNVLNEYDYNRLDQMAFSFRSLELEKGLFLVRTGEKSDIFFLLEQGEVKIYQNSSQRTLLPLSIITPGQFIGEEIIKNLTSTYEFTAIISSPIAHLSIITKGVFLSKFPSECRKSVITTYESKKSNRISILQRFNQNDKFQNMRKTYCAAEIGNKTSRYKQLQSLKNNALDTTQTYKQFELNFMSPVVNRFDQTINRQAVNLNTLREKPNKLLTQKGLIDKQQMKFQKLQTEVGIQAESLPQSLTVRRKDNCDYLNVFQIVESTNQQFQRKQLEMSQNTLKNYGFFAEEIKYNKEQKQLFSSIDTGVSESAKINPKNRLDFGRGDIERQLRKEHFFQIVKSLKPLRVDYMDHDFHILKSVIGNKFKSDFKRNELTNGKTTQNSPNTSAIKLHTNLEMSGEVSPMNLRLGSLPKFEMLSDNGTKLSQHSMKYLDLREKSPKKHLIYSKSNKDQIFQRNRHSQSQLDLKIHNKAEQQLEQKLRGFMIVNNKY